MAYSIWQRFITDGGEQVVTAALISVYLESSGAPATIYDGPSGSPIGSTTTSDITGKATFYAPAGVYKIVASKGAFSAEFRHVQLGNAQSRDVGADPEDLVTQENLSAATENLVDPTAQIDATVDGTVIIAAATTALDFTGSLSANKTIDCTNIIEAFPVPVYSTNGITAVTLSGTGLTFTGDLTTLPAGGVALLTRNGTVVHAAGLAYTASDVGALATTSDQGLTPTQQQNALDNLGLPEEDGSSKIGFLQAGIGAVARTVQDKARESVSVKDFGAVGDGVADDTAEIQAALDYVSSVGGELHFPPGTYLTSAKLTISGSNVSLRGSNRGASIIQSSASVGIGANDTTVRRHCKISGLKVRVAAANAIGIDFTYFSYSDFSFNTIEVAGNNSSAFYGIGNVAGSSPYYNTFYQNYLGRTSPATGGCTGYKLDQYVSGGTRRGPNSNTFIGGRVSSMQRSIDLQAGSANVFMGIASESVASGGYHVWLGADTPHYSGTATAGAINSLTDSLATLANLANGGVYISGGTGSGQYNRIDSNTGTVITMARNFVTAPDNTSVYEASGVTAIGNSFYNLRMEGISGANGIGESLSAYGNEFFGTRQTSLGAGKSIDTNLFPDGDYFAFNYYKPMQDFTFTLDDVAAGLTNQALRCGGGSATQILMPFDGDIVGIAVNSSASRSGGTLTVNPTVNGTVITGVSAVLNADVTNNNVQMVPPRANVIGGKNRRIGAVVTTDGSWTPVTADISVTVFVLPRG